MRNEPQHPRPQIVGVPSSPQPTGYRNACAGALSKARKANLGEIAVQEAMNALALTAPGITGVFLFEDHKIARTSFLLPDNCRKVSTRAWLLFLEGKGWIGSAADIERAAISNGRSFSRLRFPV